MKIDALLYWVFPENRSEISPFTSVVRLPTYVYELVNKRTKFMVVYGRLPPIFGGRVRLPARLPQTSTSGLPNS